MRIVFYFSILSSILLFSCSGNNSDGEVITPLKDTIADTYEERLADVDKYSGLFFGNDSTPANPLHAEKLIAAYNNFIENHSLDKKTMEYTFNAAEVSKAINKPHEAIRYLNIVIERYTTYEKAPAALFYKAMVLDDMLNDDDAAKIYYEEFIEKYPDHPLTESARASIQLLGKSLEEIVADFEKQNS